MKKFFLFAAVLLSPMFLGLAPCNAGIEREIHLNNYGKNKEVVQILGPRGDGICLIEAVLDVDDNGYYTIGLRVENEDVDGHILYLFGDSFTRKDLRVKMSPSVVYAKGFVEAYTQKCLLLTGEGRDHVRLMPGESDIVEIHGKEGDPSFKRTLPLYFATSKGYIWKRHALLECNNVELTFVVDIRQPESYKALSDEVDRLLAKVSNQTYTVCRHEGKKHNEDLEEQQAKTRRSLDSLSLRIENEMKSLQRASKRYKEFFALKERLMSFDVGSIAVKTCNRGGDGCRCSQQVKNLSLDEILRKMDDLSQKIHNAKRTGKGSVEERARKEVEGLWIHCGHIHRDPNGVKTRIKATYEKIKNI